MKEQSKNGIILEVQEGIENTPSNVRGNYSDGYHTFNELYEFRKTYNAALFNEWANFRINPPDGSEPVAKFDVHKSWNHNDGQPCFGGGWFIVVATLPTGQISNHYEAKDWDLFKIPEAKNAKHPFDGHTSADVVVRLNAL
jgi:hypothetical protein